MTAGAGDSPARYIRARTDCAASTLMFSSSTSTPDMSTASAASRRRWFRDSRTAPSISSERSVRVPSEWRNAGSSRCAMSSPSAESISFYRFATVSASASGECCWDGGANA